MCVAGRRSWRNCVIRNRELVTEIEMRRTKKLKQTYVLRSVIQDGAAPEEVLHESGAPEEEVFEL